MPLRSNDLGSACAVLSACVFSSGAARAQSASDRALAESLFHEGRRLLEAGQAEAACPKLAESHRIAPALGALLNLATCHEKVGKTASAWAEFSEAATLARRLGQTAREQFATERAAKLLPELSKLTLVVANTEGVTVELDQRSIGPGAWGTPMPVDPGGHDVRASAPGKVAWQTAVTIPRGPASITVSVPELAPEPTAVAVAPPPPIPATPPAAPEPTKRTEPKSGAGANDASGPPTAWIAVSGGFAAVGFAVGTYFGVRTFSEKKTIDKYCDDEVCSDPRGLEAEERAYDAALLSTIGFGVGLAASGVLVYLLLAPRGEGGGASGIELSPAVGSDGFGVSSTLRF